MTYSNENSNNEAAAKQISMSDLGSVSDTKIDVEPNGSNVITKSSEKQHENAEKEKLFPVPKDESRSPSTTKKDNRKRGSRSDSVNPSGNRSKQFNSPQISPKTLKNKYLESNKDLVLKLMASELYNYMGYSTFIEANVSTYNYGDSFRRETVSDIDVYALKFDFDLRCTSVVIECKSGEHEALDHLLKLKGICQLRGSSYGILVQNRIPTNSREVASQLGLTTWDQTELLNILKSANLWVQDAEDKLIDIFIARSELQKEASKSFSKFSKFLSTDYWLSPEFKNIQTIITGIPQLKTSLKDHIPAHRYLIDQAALLFMVSSIRAANSILQNYQSLPQDRLKDYLFGGARERRDREVLFDKVNQLMGEKSSFLPDYFSGYAELVIRYVNNPFFAKDIPYIWTQFINMQFDSSHPISNSALSRAEPVALKLTRDAIRFLSKLLGFRPAHWEAFLNG